MKSLAYLEVEGLSAAVNAADKMLKTADVDLEGIQNVNGLGWVMVSITGDVAAVSVAIDAGKEAAGDHCIGSTVIANPAKGVAGLSEADPILGKGVKAAKKQTAAATKPKPSSTQSATPAKTTPNKPAQVSNKNRASKTNNRTNQNTKPNNTDKK